MSMPMMPVVPMMPPMPPSMVPQPIEQNPPNQTIYVNNLNEKIKHDELKKSLYAIFAQFGKILDIITRKNLKMRGQAFVVFQELSSAERALTAMQSFPFYNKPMRIQYARADSDIVAKAKGTFMERPKRQWQANGPNASGEEPTKKKKKKTSDKKGSGKKSEKTGSSGEQPPNKILFVTNLPTSTSQPILESLFSRFPGFCEVRMVPQRPDIAFIEYTNELEANQVKITLQSYCLEPGHAMKITFAKK